MSSGDDLLTRSEVLEGLAGRRVRQASTLLFLIEARTAHLAARSATPDDLLVEESASERDLAFLEAFALARRPPHPPTIQQIEEQAPRWAALVPPSPDLQAAVAQMLGQKYRFTAGDVPRIRAALGLETAAVQGAYERQTGAPLPTLYTRQISPLERLRWVTTAVGKWLQTLPPFWTTVVSIVTLSLSQGVLALPIAVAGIGPAPAVMLLVALGLINILTMACMAEAFGRSGSIRYGSTFTGRVVSDYVGSAGNLILVAATSFRMFVGLVACYIGLTTAVATLTSVPAQAWAVVLFAAGVSLLLGQSLTFSTGLSVLLGATSVGLLVLIGLLASNHLRLSNLSFVDVPFMGGPQVQLTGGQAALGVAIQSYIGHSYLTQSAKSVLPRDAGGRSLTWGSIVGSVMMMVLLSSWVLVVNGAVPPIELAREAGTAITPLARVVGPVVAVLGSPLIVFLLGLSFIRQSNVLFNLVRERVRKRRPPILLLPRRRARLLLHPRGNPNASPHLAVSYLGLEAGLPQIRLDAQLDGRSRHLQTAVSGSWDAVAALAREPKLSETGVRLVLDVVDAAHDGLRIRVNSSLALAFAGDWVPDGLLPVDLLELPDDSRELVTWMLRRREVSLPEVVAHTGSSPQDARALLESLVEQGAILELEVEGGSRFRPQLGDTRPRHLPDQIWQALQENAGAATVAPGEGGRSTRGGRSTWIRRLWAKFDSDRLRLWLCISPVALTFLLAELLLVTGAGSFTQVVSIGGVLGNSIVAGIFPVLLLVSSRRKGELVPDVIIKALGHPLVVGAIYLLFVGVIFIHGLFIWQGWVERTAALTVGLLVVAGTFVMQRQGAFSRRLIVELRREVRAQGEGPVVFSVTEGGRPLESEVHLGDAQGEQQQRTATGQASPALRWATFHFPATAARELKVWSHRVTAEGDSEGLPALVEVADGHHTEELDLTASGGQALLRISGGPGRITITLPDSHLA